jgi:phenylalanyl-tRNA synthetase beta chain
MSDTRVDRDLLLNGMKISYNWLQNYFEEKLPNPEKISEMIVFHSFEVEEVEKINSDFIFDIKILPDRAHDCLSHFGIAKEISALFDLNLKKKENQIFDDKNTNLKIKIESDNCLRYMGRIVRNIKVLESPDWLKERLNAIGQKSINNIVDAANFVMFDLGQPIHCFDLDKLAGPEIIVRSGKTGEKITTLDKKEINLDESILVIADQNDPLAIAGIKGGNKAEVDNNTKNIVIEVANFNPTTTRKTAKKVNIQTDAVKRYENEISPELCGKTMEEISDLIFKLAGGEFENIVDEYKNKPEPKAVSIRVDYVNKRLGSNFSKAEIESVWNKLNFEYEVSDEEFVVKIPALRLDLNFDYDLTEEVIRVLGYDRLEEKLPEIKLESKLDETFTKMLLVRKKFLDDGYSEVMTYSFTDRGEVEVLASASDKNFLRTNLTDGVKKSYELNKRNLPLLEMDEVKIFEIGTIFNKTGEQINICWADKSGVQEMSLLEFTGEKLSSEVHGYNSLEKFLVLAPSRSQGTSEETSLPSIFQPWSVYPFITRDIAVWTPEGTKSEELAKIYKELGTELLVREPKLFDQFTKEGRTSYAFRLVFQSYEKTLTDEEINQIMSNIEQKISSLGWVVR